MVRGGWVRTTDLSLFRAISLPSSILSTAVSTEMADKGSDPKINGAKRVLYLCPSRPENAVRTVDTSELHPDVCRYTKTI